MWLVALRKLYEAEVAESTAVIDTFLQNSVGVADHDNFIKTIKSQFDKRVHARHAISEIDEITKNVTKEKDVRKENKEN